MKKINLIVLWGVAALLLSLFGMQETAEAALKKGEVAPTFAALDAVKKKPMVLVYFFKLDSKPAREGLDYLKGLSEQYEKDGMTILAVTQDGAKLLDPYLKEHPLPFPVVRDDGKIFSAYQVKVILPTTYILGPGNRITDTLEGGGPSSTRFITTVAQRGLQLKKTTLAKGLFETALKSNPKDTQAAAGLGHVFLKEGKLDRAESEFSKLAQLKSPEAILGKEGLAEVHLQKGETDKALAVAEEVEKEEPNNGLVHLVKGNVLAGQGKQPEALAEFTRAAEGKLSTDWQRATAYNNAGRIYSEQGQYPLAEKMYQEAVIHNPYSSEILSNRGVLYERQGQPQKALALYQEALSADPEDEVAKHLMKRMEQHLAFKEDLERQKRIDTLVADLTERFKTGKVADLPAADPWSSKPMTVAFLGLKLMGGGLLREGMSEVLQAEMTQRLSAGGRVAVVEREMLDKLLAELKLGSSELADPETALKLGKLLSARLIVTGSLVQIPEGVRLSLRLIDPETSAIKITYADEMNTQKNLMTLADQTAQAIGKKLKEQYPLKGKIASVEAGEQVIVNLGTRHGIKPGTKLKIIDEGEAIVVDGKTIGFKKTRVGLLEIVEVEEGMSYGKLTEHKTAVQKDQKVLEEIGGNDAAF
ncbi:MAG: tetratricopeptide repeat protein [Nitrospirae bacterium]|nr:tetratricopeptide repeat protein [Candidatus Manganitrophaceae bacterium]